MDNYISQTYIPGYSDQYKHVCIKSYIKQLQATQENMPIVANGRFSSIIKQIKQDFNPKGQFISFLRDFFPGLLVGFIMNLTKASGNALLAINLTIQDQAHGVNYAPGDFRLLDSQVRLALSNALPYLSVEDAGFKDKARELDELLEDYAQFLTRRKDMDVKVAEKVANALGARAKKMEFFIDDLKQHAEQIAKNIAGKTEDEIIENAQNALQKTDGVSPKPVGMWGRVVNWVKNKLGKGKAFGIKSIQEGELNLFISNMGLAYHLAATASSLLEKISKTSIMNRLDPNPRTLAPDMFNSFMDEIEDTFSFLAPENVPTLDYITIKTKVDALCSCAKVYLSALSDETIDPSFKIIQLRSVCLLIINNLRDVIPACLKMDPLLAVTDI